MSAPPEFSLDELADRLCAEQHQTWARSEPILVEAYLERHPALAGDRLHVFTLIYNEYLVRERLGEPASPEEYFGRFPEFAERLRRQLAVHQAVEASRIPDGNGLVTPLLDVHLRKPAPARAGSPVFPKTSRFRMLRRLGAGAMGAVYAAYDRRWNQSIALKVLHENNAAATHRMKREFRVLAELSHPNLVDLHELFWSEEHQQCFFTMELVKGQDLVDYCRSARLSPEIGGAGYACLYDVFRQLAEALNTLHKAGTLHCDIKPPNVLVTEAGRPVLLDFGLAYEHVRPHRGEHLRGTVAYMAPEQLQGERPSPASDWYSFGGILYQALTGKLPIPGSAQQIVAAKPRHDPLPPSSLVPGLPDDLDRLCRDLLRRDPAHRPGATEILLRLGAGHPTAAPRLRMPSGERLPFVGRERELVRIREALHQADKGRFASLLVRGASGTGKSELVRQFLSELESQREVLILSGRCHEVEFVPFRAFDELMDNLSRYLEKLPLGELENLLPPNLAPLTRVFPTLLRVPTVAARAVEPVGSQSRAELRKQAVHALCNLLNRLGQQRRLVLFIDDLQWGGLDSEALLSELFQVDMEIPLLLLGTCCSEEARPGSCRVQKSCLDEGLWRDELVLDDLPVADARQLAFQCLEMQGCPSAKHAEAVIREAGGHPFLIVTLAHLSHCADDSGRPATVPPAAQIDELLWERICRLSDPARRLLETIGVAGYPLNVTHACRAAQIGIDAQRVLRALRSQRLIRIDQMDRGDNLVELSHHRIRECVVGHLTDEVIRHCHQCLAQVLESSRRPNPQLLARHYLAAGEPSRAYELAAVAADNASRLLAFEEAAELYRLALQTFQGSPTERLALQQRLAECLATADRAIKAGLAR